MSETRYTPEQIAKMATELARLQNGHMILKCDQLVAMLRQAATDAEALAAKDKEIARLKDELEMSERYTPEQMREDAESYLHADSSVRSLRLNLRRCELAEPAEDETGYLGFRSCYHEGTGRPDWCSACLHNGVLRVTLRHALQARYSALRLMRRRFDRSKKGTNSHDNE